MRYFVTTLLALLLAVNLVGDGNAISIRGGVLVPSGSKTGFMPGLFYGINVDDIVDLGVGTDFFFKSYSEQRKLSFDTSKAGNDVEEITTGTEIKTGYIPLMAALRVAVPVGWSVTPFAGFGVGWGILWEDILVPESVEGIEKHEKVEEVNIYSGFNWDLQLGVKYKLSDKIHVFGESFYNFGKMKKDRKTTDFGRTWKEIDMSGIGFRGGIEIGLN